MTNYNLWTVRVKNKLTKWITLRVENVDSDVTLRNARIKWLLTANHWETRNCGSFQICLCNDQPTLKYGIKPKQNRIGSLLKLWFYPSEQILVPCFYQMYANTPILSRVQTKVNAYLQLVFLLTQYDVCV